MNSQPSIKELREQKRQMKLARRTAATSGSKRRWLIWGGSLIGLAVVIAGMVYLARPASNTNSQDTVLGLQDSDHRLGPKDAPAVLIEYSDLQCPACKAYSPLVNQLHQEYPETLAIAYRHYPLRQIHQNAFAATLAAEAADKQGKFWEYHDLMFERQASWSTLTNPRQTFLDYAKELKLDVSQFTKDMDSSAVEARVNADISSGDKAKVDSTPTFFLNGQKITNPASVEDFKKLIDDAIKNRPLTQGESTKVHLHADIRVMVDGQQIDFAQDKYQSTKDNELSPKIHFHSGVGKVFHVHEAKATLNDLFTSLGMKLTKDCFITDDGKEHCRSDSQAVKLFINGQENQQFGDYEPKDLDRIVLLVGAMTAEEMSAAVDTVSDEACIYSEKCPERGAPPTEECVGGLGTDCN